MDFGKTETNLFLHFVRAEEGSGEESVRASGIFLAFRAYAKFPQFSFLGYDDFIK
ncbi:MAG: hypothetical protein ACSLEX_01035 [Minisyncoccota bacterium]